MWDEDVYESFSLNSTPNVKVTIYFTPVEPFVSERRKIVLSYIHVSVKSEGWGLLTRYVRRSVCLELHFSSFIGQVILLLKLKCILNEIK